MTETKRFDPPKETAMDHAVAGVKELVDLAPGGKLANFLLDRICNPPLQLRLNGWRKEVSEFLNELDENGRIDIEKLRENPEFIDVVTSATRIAVATSVEEKRKALKNAVLNTAKNIDVLFTEKMIFLRFVDQFTDWHLQILSLFNNPREFFSPDRFSPFEPGRTTLEKILLKGYPELKGRNVVYSFIWNDLVNNKLVFDIRINKPSRSDSWDSSQTTKFGKQFMQFISESE